jgi:hypothetical protein
VCHKKGKGAKSSQGIKYFFSENETKDQLNKKIQTPFHLPYERGFVNGIPIVKIKRHRRRLFYL